MQQLNNRQATWYAIIILFLTGLLSIIWSNLPILISGLLIVIIITQFIGGKKVTLLAGLASLLAATGFVIYLQNNQLTNLNIWEELFMALLIVFATVLTTYLKELYHHLTFDKTHMSSLFENATEGILLTNSHGKIVLVNPAAEKVFGYSAFELVGHSIEILIPMKSRGGHEALRQGFYKAPGNRTMGIGRDLYARRKDGSEFPVEVSLSYYKQKTESYVIAFVVDITKRKEIENSMLQQKKELEKLTDDMRKLNAKLEAKVEERTLILKEALLRLEESQKELSESLDKERQLNEIKSRFVSMASHEFRTPLSTILSSATLVSKYPLTEDNDKRDRHLRKIKDSVSHLNDLLEDFLSLGKLDEGKVEVLVSSFPVKDFIEDVVDEMKVLLKSNQLIECSYIGETNFSTDKRLLKNSLINLLSNAIKFSGEGTKVWLSVDNDSKKLTFSVKDEGVGIPEEDQPHLFTTFFRARNVTNIQGTGLGLPIVKRYLDLMHGTIRLESKQNAGTAFYVDLPALKDDATPL